MKKTGSLFLLGVIVVFLLTAFLFLPYALGQFRDAVGEKTMPRVLEFFAQDEGRLWAIYIGISLFGVHLYESAAREYDWFKKKIPSWLFGVIMGLVPVGAILIGSFAFSSEVSEIMPAKGIVVEATDASYVDVTEEISPSPTPTIKQQMEYVVKSWFWLLDGRDDNVDIDSALSFGTTDFRKSFDEEGHISKEGLHTYWSSRDVVGMFAFSNAKTYGELSIHVEIEIVYDPGDNRDPYTEHFDYVFFFDNTNGMKISGYAYTAIEE